MGRLEWSSSVRVLALLLTAFFFVASVLQLVLMLDLTGAHPAPLPAITDNIEQDFAFNYGRWPIDFASQALFALGFLSLAGVGVLLSRLADAFDARRSLAATLFVGSGLLGAAASLVWIGVAPVATFPHYCDCNLRDAELAARLISLDVSSSVAVWFTIGGIVLASLGLVLVVRLGVEAGLSRGWMAMTYLSVVAGLLAAVLAAFDLSPVSDYTAAAVAGIIIPIWGIWLAIGAPRMASPDGGSTEPAMDSAVPG